MRVYGRLLAAVVVVALPVPTAANAAPSRHHRPSPLPGASHNVTFGAGPATDKKIDGRPYFTYDSSPGGVIDDHIGIVNFANKKQKLNIYTVDATTTTTGNVSYSPKAAKRTDAGAWLAVGSPRSAGLVTVPPRSRTILPVHLRVPTNAQPGDHAAAIIVSLTGLVKGKSGQRINLEQRVATRVIVRVSGDLHPQLEVNNLHVSYAGHLNPLARGTATVTYTINNTGNAVLGAAQHVEIKGLFGTTTQAPTLPGIPALLPGGSYPVTVHVADVFPEIRMTATVSLTPQGLQGDVNPGIHAVSASTHFWAVPWLLIAIVLLLLLAIAVEIARRRRRRKEPGRHRTEASPAADPPRNPAPEGATT